MGAPWISLLVLIVLVSVSQARPGSHDALRREHAILSNQHDAVRERRQAPVDDGNFSEAKWRNWFNRTDFNQDGMLFLSDIRDFVKIITSVEGLNTTQSNQLSDNLFDAFMKYFFFDLEFLSVDTFIFGVKSMMKGNGSDFQWWGNGTFTALFNAKDANGLGYVPRDEYVELYTRANFGSSANATAAFIQIDIDPMNLKITLNEYLKVAFDYFRNKNPSDQYSLLYWGPIPGYPGKVGKR